jgi:hypothetical protein
MNLTSGVAVMQSAKKAKVVKKYASPSLTKLKPQEAQQFLLQHAKMGDLGAKEMLNLVLPGHKMSGY